MTEFKLLLPQMGESIAEATLIKWLKDEGDSVQLDESVVEIATDKIDSDIPSPVEGIFKKKLFNEGDIIKIGQPIAIIEISSEESVNNLPYKYLGDAIPEKNISKEVKAPTASVKNNSKKEKTLKEINELENQMEKIKDSTSNKFEPNRFYSPLVKTIAKEEGIPLKELELISGTGKDHRVTKRDILNYLEKRDKKVSNADEVIEMDRMRKIIAHRMLNSVQTSPHVTSFVEADVTNIVEWRNKVKAKYLRLEGEPITFTPIFIKAVVKAIKDFPMINASLDGDKIIVKKQINIGIATALPNGNLIVPVIKNTDRYSLIGLSKIVNDLARRARENNLNPDEVKDGTYTITNVGKFGNVMGTPIINQPQIGILAIGTIRKIPAVIETPNGDFIGIRQRVFLSHSYDHRIVDGELGGSFAKRVADYLEKFDKTIEF